jgi:hypothetical protein
MLITFVYLHNTKMEQVVFDIVEILTMQSLDEEH